VRAGVSATSRGRGSRRDVTGRRGITRSAASAPRRPTISASDRASRGHGTLLDPAAGRGLLCEQLLQGRGDQVAGKAEFELSLRRGRGDRGIGKAVGDRQAANVSPPLRRRRRRGSRGAALDRDFPARENASRPASPMRISSRARGAPGRNPAERRFLQTTDRLGPISPSTTTSSLEGPAGSRRGIRRPSAPRPSSAARIPTHGSSLRRSGESGSHFGGVSKERSARTRS